MNQKELTVEQTVIQELSTQVGNLNAELVYANVIIKKLQEQNEQLQTVIQSLTQETTEEPKKEKGSKKQK